MSVAEQPTYRRFDDDTLLDMYDHAHEVGDEQCDAIAAELHWRGIEVPPCKYQHRGGTVVEKFDT